MSEEIRAMKMKRLRVRTTLDAFAASRHPALHTAKARELRKEAERLSDHIGLAEAEQELEEIEKKIASYRAEPLAPTPILQNLHTRRTDLLRVIERLHRKIEEEEA